ncbi:MAG: FixH family protein [Hyphomicrobium sp.]|uniref:FixH family protein n=1 Tax=Hyphomicrobium sp. TaxID=82 RepID=UPI0039E54822
MKQAVGTRGGINGWHVLFGMVGFFIAVTAVDSLMIYKALSTFAGDTPDAYREGLDYNDRIAEERRQDELGWTETTKFDSSSGNFKFTLTDRQGNGVEGLKIIGTLGRPATDIADRAVTLTDIGQGTYSLAVAGLAEGNWEISLQAARTSDPKSEILYRSKVHLWKQP